jgi:hypothetical protein
VRPEDSREAEEAEPTAALADASHPGALAPEDLDADDQGAADLDADVPDGEPADDERSEQTDDVDLPEDPDDDVADRH